MIYPNYPQFMAMMWGNADKPWELRVSYDQWSSCHRQNGPSVEWTQADGKKVPCRAVHAFHVPNHWFFGFHFRRQSIGKAQHGIKQAAEGEDELEFW